MNIFRLCFVSLVNLNKILVRRHIYPSTQAVLNQHLRIRCKHTDIEPTNDNNKNPSNPRNQKFSYTKNEPFKILYAITKSGDGKQLRDKLSEGLLADLNILDKHDYTLLMKAAEDGQIECVKVLLEFGALVDLPPIEGDNEDEAWYDRSNAIYLATEKGRVDIVKLLLKADPKAELNHPQFRPMYTACHLGHLEMAKLLVEHGAQLQDENDEYGTNALMQACESGNAELVEYLISTGADVNYENKHNPHALLVACRGRYLGVMEVLLKHDADVDIFEMRTDSEEDTCLNLACHRGDMEMIRLLLKYGADMTAFNQQGLSPFTTAYTRGNKEAVDLFLEHGIDLNSNAGPWHYEKDGEMLPIRDKWTPLMHACARNDIEMVKRLIAHGADVNVASQSAPGEPYDYNSAVLESIRNKELLQILLDHGADVNLTDALENTPLLTLVKPQEDPYSGREDYDTEDPDLLHGVRMLLEHGLNLMH